MLDFIKLLKKTKNKNVEFYYKLLNVKDLPYDIKERCYKKIVKSPKWSCKLRQNFPDISEEIKRKAEKESCKKSGWAFYLVRNVEDVPENIRKTALEKISESPFWSYKMVRDIKNLPYDKKERGVNKFLEKFYTSYLFLSGSKGREDLKEIRKRAIEKWIENDARYIFSLRKESFLFEDEKRIIELECMRNCRISYYLRREVKDLPEDVKRRAEDKCLEDPYWTCHLRRYIKDLPEDVKRRAEKIILKDDGNFRNLFSIKDVSEKILKKAKEKRKRMVKKNTKERVK